MKSELSRSEKQLDPKKKSSPEISLTEWERLEDTS